MRSQSSAKIPGNRVVGGHQTAVWRHPSITGQHDRSARGASWTTGELTPVATVPSVGGVTTRSAGVVGTPLSTGITYEISCGDH